MNDTDIRLTTKNLQNHYPTLKGDRVYMKIEGTTAFVEHIREIGKGLFKVTVQWDNRSVLVTNPVHLYQLTAKQVNLWC